MTVMGSGLQTDEVKGALNIAGYWTLGVGKGLMITAIPVVMLALGVGFMRKVVKIGTRVGGD